MKSQKENCKLGKHDFINIFNKYAWDESECVTKWCKYCGAVKVVWEYDGRIGENVFPLTLPKILNDLKV